MPESYALLSVTYLLGASPYTPPAHCRALIVRPGKTAPPPAIPITPFEADTGWGWMKAYGFGPGQPPALYREGDIHDPDILAIIAQSNGLGGEGVTIIWEFGE